MTVCSEPMPVEKPPGLWCECPFRPASVVPATAGASDEAETLLCQAGCLGASGSQARKKGDEAAADEYLREALGLATRALNLGNSLSVDQVEARYVAADLALRSGDAEAAGHHIEVALKARPELQWTEAWAQMADVSAWTDEWLIAAVRRDPPHVPALDVLAERYWKPLVGRCYLLTLNYDRAADLAQHAWCRVLRARAALKPGGNFPAYLSMVATNLWRDANRSSRRAGPLAEQQLTSLDADLGAMEEGDGTLGEIIPDWQALNQEEGKQLMEEVDAALARLSPLLRDVLIARLIDGQSCAEIGRRYGRTEQTVSGWVRQGISAIRVQLDPGGRRTREERTE